MKVAFGLTCFFALVASVYGQQTTCNATCQGSYDMQRCRIECERTASDRADSSSMGPLRAMWAAQEQDRREKMQQLELERMQLENERLRRSLQR